jgi:hypothetical protein
VVADADPSAIAQVVDRFRNQNVVPRRVLAEMTIDDRLYIEVDVSGMSEEQLSLITAKIREAPSVIHTQWHPL